MAEDGKESCECEDDFPPGAGFAFRREGYAMVNLEAGNETRQRTFFENARLTFKEILVPGDGKTLPQVYVLFLSCQERLAPRASSPCADDTQARLRRPTAQCVFENHAKQHGISCADAGSVAMVDAGGAAGHAAIHRVHFE